MKATWQTNGNTSIKKVFVGLSGGVDSAVSAALLQQQGYDVTGVFIRIAIEGYPCTAGADKLDAMRVAAQLRIPFLTVDLSSEYTERVFETSVAEFAKGRTPNPDTLCNKEIKFGLFFDWCMAQGADLVATGHYAQLQKAKLPQKKVLGSPHFVRPDHFSEQVLLFAGADSEKDQSYFLWAVPEKILRKTLFPVGGLTKTGVRALAKKFGLPNAERKDSQGLCFLGPISIDEMLHRELVLVPGDVLDERGTVVGTHEGAAAYTMGQRHGFTLFAHTPHTAPHFVVGKDVERNTITISAKRFPQHSRGVEITLTDTNWIGEAPNGPCEARYRYRQALIPAEKKDNIILLYEPHFAPEGQSLVLYRGAQCLGGGIIEHAWLYQ